MSKSPLRSERPRKTKAPHADAAKGAADDSLIRTVAEFRKVSAVVRSISRIFEGFPEWERTRARVTAVLALSDYLESALKSAAKDERVMGDASTHELLIKMLEALPGRETPIRQCDAGAVARALGKPGLSLEQGNRRRNHRKPEYAQAKALVKAAMSEGSLTRSRRGELRRGIFNLGVAMSTASRWLKKIEEESTHEKTITG